MRNLKNITLEMSLKPFKSINPDAVESVCREIFDQWKNMIKHADMVSILLWTSDGSEILDYKGDMEETMEWAKYIGGANPRDEQQLDHDPQQVGLHTRYYLYMDNPPEITYGIFKNIVGTLKRIGTEVTGKPVRIGATFDPGPEFAKSEFKYQKHEEICMGNTMGRKSFVCCYAVLHEDTCKYASYPEGIPEGTPFGTFFGKQCNVFLRDMGFDYLWLSNGFGFGTETWGITGAIFDGESFATEKMDETQERILEFWKLFRAECPEIPVETRGTNLTAGIDLSTDGVPLKAIYEGGFNILPPPNSPWAAINGDFGLELAGYMSRIAELPKDNDYLYRFYIHDPWWMNSPWFDRYEGQPHDIYLPLAVARVDGEGEIVAPNHLNLLTIDNSLGDMPESFANEVTPHLLTAYEHQPDEVSPLVWVYPFREYHEIASTGDRHVERMFSEDWFIKGAINHGLPLSTVVSTDNFAKTVAAVPDFYEGSIIVTPVPDKNSDFEKVLLDFLKDGGRAVIYGSLENASEQLLQALHVKRTTPLQGILTLQLNLTQDHLKGQSWPEKINHRELVSDGGIDTVLADECDEEAEVLASVCNDEETRVAALKVNRSDWKGGSTVWVRGTNSCGFQPGEHLLRNDRPSEYFLMEGIMRLVLQTYGYDILFSFKAVETRKPVVMIHRNRNAFYFSGYVPDTTASMKFRFPLGAPLLIGNETSLAGGYTEYHMPRAWHKECRVFVEQEEDSIVSCCECPPVSYQARRRILVKGLKNATVRIFPQSGFEEKTELLLNSRYPHIVGEEIQWKRKSTPWGEILEAVNITGEVMISTCYVE